MIPTLRTEPRKQSLTPGLPLLFRLALDRGVFVPLDPEPLELCVRYDTNDPELMRGGSSRVSRTLADLMGWQ